MIVGRPCVIFVLQRRGGADGAGLPPALVRLERRQRLTGASGCAGAECHTAIPYVDTEQLPCIRTPRCARTAATLPQPAQQTHLRISHTPKIARRQHDTHWHYTPFCSGRFVLSVSTDE